MKILTLVWSVGIGGTERAAVNFAIGYKRYGCDSRVLVLGNGYDRCEELAADHVDTILLGRSTLSADVIFKQLQQWAPDIIHIHSFSNSLLDYINRIKGSHTKVVETNVFSRPLYSKNYTAVHLSLQLTSWGFWRYSRRMAHAAYKPAAAVIPNIVVPEKFLIPAKDEIEKFRSSYQLPVNAFVAGRLGQAHPSKWDERLIDVISQTIHKDNEIYYLLAGVPENISRQIDMQNDFFRSRVKLISKITGDENISLFYHSLDCFVHLSKIGESFGYVLAESMLCKVPVISLATPFKDNGQYEVIAADKKNICVTGIKEMTTAVLRCYQNKLRPVNTDVKCTDNRFYLATVIPATLRLFDQLLKGEPVSSYYNNDAVQSFFSFYKKKHPVKSLLVKCVNTAFFYRLSNLYK